jgi:hypothetical protein
LTTRQLAALQELVDRTGLPDPSDIDAISELTERALILPVAEKWVLVKRWVEKRLEWAASKRRSTEQWLMNRGNSEPPIMPAGMSAQAPLRDVSVPSSFGPDAQPPSTPTPSPPAGAQPNREAVIATPSDFNQERQLKERLVCHQ